VRTADVVTTTNDPHGGMLGSPTDLGYRDSLEGIGGRNASICAQQKFLYTAYTNAVCVHDARTPGVTSNNHLDSEWGAMLPKLETQEENADEGGNKGDKVNSTSFDQVRPGTQHDPQWLGHLPVFIAGILAIWWLAGMTAVAWRKPHRPPGTAGVWTAMAAVGSLGDWVLVGATPKGTLTDAEFKQATWDVVNLDTERATEKWGILGDWDVSVVKDFSYAFSTYRNETGGYQSGNNPKAAKFIGVGLDAWITSAVTDLGSTFNGASSMNVDVGKWDLSKVTTLRGTFYKAAMFTGGGLDAWITSAVTDLGSTFYGASSMNVDVGKWDVSKVTTLYETFSNAAKFTGGGLDAWITSAVTTLEFTFNGASLMNVDVGKWDVAKVTTLYGTFQSAAMFTG
jgi:surface protein